MVSGNPPLVSVIIPCYNESEFLSEAVQSVIEQSFKKWECIIVNDGSTDNTSEVAQKLMSKYSDHAIFLLEKENGGLASARNYGIRASHGRYILPLDADDMIAPTMIEKGVNLLESNPKVAISYSAAREFGDSVEVFPLMEYDFHRLCRINFLKCTALFRREAFDAVGGYNTDMVRGYEDWDFWIGCGEKGFYGKRIPEILFFFRVRKNSMYSMSLKYDKKLKARIILNHSSLYTKSQVRWANGIMANDANTVALPDIPGIMPEFYETEACDELSAEEKSLPPDAGAEMESANGHYRAGNLRLAENIYRNILREYPNSAISCYYLARVLHEQGRLNEAILYYEKSLQFNPETAEAYNNLGLALFETGKVYESAKCYMKALLLNPEFADAYYNMGILLRNTGYFNVAKQCYRKVIELKPDLADAHMNLGNILLQTGEHEEATACFQRAHELGNNEISQY
jgi:glycosyltransferase involved in cell wall biosynthesis